MLCAVLLHDAHSSDLASANCSCLGLYRPGALHSTHFEVDCHCCHGWMKAANFWCGVVTCIHAEGLHQCCSITHALQLQTGAQVPRVLYSQWSQDQMLVLVLEDLSHTPATHQASAASVSYTLPDQSAPCNGNGQHHNRPCQATALDYGQVLLCLCHFLGGR